MAANGLIQLDMAAGIASLTLNDPERRNPLSPTLVTELLTDLTHLAADDDCRVVLLHGAGRGFCAGADLKRMKMTTVEEDRDEYGQIIKLNLLLRSYPKPTIAAVHGFALGGGCSLMNWCDFAFAEDGTRLGFPEVAKGLPSATVIPTLLALVGRRATLDLVLRARIIDAAEAAEIGLITGRVPPGQSVAAAMDLGHELAALDTRALRLTKQILHTVEDLPYEKAIEHAKEIRVLARVLADQQAAPAGDRSPL